MRGSRGGWVVRVVLVLLAAQASAAPVWGQLTVTATASAPSAEYVSPGKEVTANLSATATNVPTGTYGCTINPPAWSWTYKVEYAATPGAWGAPPPDAGYSVTIDPPPATNPSPTTLKATFNKAGYWRVTELTAAVEYTSTCSQSWTASGKAQDVKVTPVTVTLSPNPSYVAVGDTALLYANVTPSGAVGQVGYESANEAVATVVGGSDLWTVTGIAPGATQVRAKLGAEVVATAAVTVVSLTHTPTSGPALTRVAFKAGTGWGAFSSSTTVTIDGVFEPTAYDSEFFSVTHSGSKVSFNPGQPDEIALAVADVFPSPFLSSTNPGLAMGLPGTVLGRVKIVEGSKELTGEVAFEITPSLFLGHLVADEFKEPDFLTVYTVTSANDLTGLDPDVLLYVQVVRPANEFTLGSPSSLTVKVRSFRDDGTPLTSGITVTLQLVSTTSTAYTYRSTKGLILINNATYEGDGPEVIAVAGNEDYYVQVVRLPP